MPIYGPGHKDFRQRLDHWRQSTSINTFLHHAQGKTLEELRVEVNREGGATGRIHSGNGLGPSGHRYLKDPLDPPKNGQPSGVIDMRHFLEAAHIPLGLGETLGAIVEEKQKWIDKFPSGRFEEDYKSNFLGVVFRNNYWHRDLDISDEFQRFFNDYGNGTLRGFVPAVERAIEQIKQRGAEGLQQLRQLREFFNQYRRRSQSTDPQADWDYLHQKFVAIEQALGKLAAASSSLATPRQLLQAHTAIKNMRRWEPYVPKAEDAKRLGDHYREQRQEFQRLQRIEEQAKQALAPLEAKGQRSFLNPWGVPAEQLAAARRHFEQATIARQNYEKDFRYTEDRAKEYVKMAEDHWKWQQSPEVQALIALEQELQQPALAQRLQQAQQLAQLFNQGLSAAEASGRSPAYLQALDQAQTAYLETGELPSETLLNAIQQDLILSQQVAQQSELGGLELA